MDITIEKKAEHLIVRGARLLIGLGFKGAC